MTRVTSKDRKANPGDKVFLVTLGGIVLVVLGAFAAIVLPALTEEGKVPSEASIVKGNE